MAFAGWNDASEAATTALRYLARAWSAERFATIDPEEFYHFGLTRPHIRFKEGSRTEREIIWPATEFSAANLPELDRDVIIGLAIEPHLKWKTYCGLILELARRCRVSLVLTLGALLADVAHYISGTETPRAALALVQRVAEFLQARVDLPELQEAARQFEQNLAEIVGRNAEIAAYVKRLEAKGAEEDEPPPFLREELPPASDLVAEIEQFLRQQRPGEAKD